MNSDIPKKKIKGETCLNLEYFNRIFYIFCCSRPNLSCNLGKSSFQPAEQQCAATGVDRISPPSLFAPNSRRKLSLHTIKNDFNILKQRFCGLGMATFFFLPPNLSIPPPGQ